MVWQRVPKNVYVSLPIVLFGFYDAIAQFNVGNRGILDILRETGIEPGHYTTTACLTSDCCHVRKAARS